MIESLKTLRDIAYRDDEHAEVGVRDLRILAIEWIKVIKKEEERYWADFDNWSVAKGSIEVLKKFFNLSDEEIEIGEPK